VLKRAEQVRAEIERDAETKRNAINAVLGDKDGKVATARPTKQAPQST
jgi:5-hydroxyisourate hydrolase-like protein (transthyretin family)